MLYAVSCDQCAPLARALVVILGILPGLTACANPKCWTHDESEVSGGCSEMMSLGGGSSGRSERSRELSSDTRQALEQRIAVQAPLCAAGNGIACLNVDEAHEELKSSADVREAAAAAACERGSSLDTRVNSACERAATLALQRGDKQLAVERFTRACGQDISSACTRASELDPSRAEELCTASPEYGCTAMSYRALAVPAAADAERALMIAAERCYADISYDACEIMGRWEAQRP